MAHSGQDLAAQGVVISFAGETERLDEVPLRQPVLLQVIGHPPGQPGELGGCGEQLPAYRLRIPALAQ